MSLCCLDNSPVTLFFFDFPSPPRDLVHVTLGFSSYQLYCDDNLSAVLAQHRFSSTMRTELSMHFIASGSHLAVYRVLRAAQAELGMFCKVAVVLDGNK